MPGETVLLDVKMKLYAPPAPDAAAELEEALEADAGPDAPFSP